MQLLLLHVSTYEYHSESRAYAKNKTPAARAIITSISAVVTAAAQSTSRLIMLDDDGISYHTRTQALVYVSLRVT